MACQPRPRRRRAAATSPRGRQRVYASRESLGTAERLETAQPTQVEAKKQEMQARRAQAVAEEFETMRAIAKKEREVAKKLEAVRLETEARIAREAAVRDAERKRKVEEKLKKSQAILKEIERKGEESRLKAIEKEKRIQAILEVPSRVAERRLHAMGGLWSKFGPLPRRGRRGDGVRSLAPTRCVSATSRRRDAVVATPRASTRLRAGV